MENAKLRVLGVELTWTILTATACGLGALVLLVKSFSRQQAKDKVLKARHRRAESLLRAEQAVQRYRESHPSTDASLILSLPLSELTKQLKEGSLNPEDVFYSYMEKTLDVNKALNCCTEILLESFDQLKTVGSRKEGLLYGVPVSIKDNFGYKGHDSSCGMCCKLDNPASQDSVLVEVLKRHGAIPFVKTNVPQSLLSYDCSNPIYGRTLNPHNLKKTPGGSSGGEGALIGGGGSLLGMGSDIGGSIRIPASFCGICGFKPTAGRLSSQVLSTTGPMARDVDSLALCMQALLCDHMFTLDPVVPPIPFNLQVYQSSRPLRIGYYENDGFLQPSPSMARGFREVKALLESAGHTLVPYAPPRVRYALYNLSAKGILADRAASLLSNMKGDPVDPCLSLQIFGYRLPHPVKKLLSVLLKPLFPRVADTLESACGAGLIQDLWKHNVAIEDYTHETIAEWRRCEMDVLLCPMLGPAYNPLYPARLVSSLANTVIYNVLNFPAGVVPVSTVTAEDEEELRHYNGNFGDIFDKNFKQAVTGSEGLPVAVQCVALPWQDELCLRFMREVEQLVKQNKVKEEEEVR
ncbi:fatty-acid amide hydrolase 1 [Diretmus argenteus]